MNLECAVTIAGIRTMNKQVQINPHTQLANLGEELNVPFLKLLGVRCLSAEMGKGEILLALKPEHNNTWEVAHGGVLAAV
jgi:acyl-coenzyme A thioesterase PaaI-like protein